MTVRGAENDGPGARAVLNRVGLGGVDLAGGWQRLEELEAKASVPPESRPRVPRRLQTREERTTKGPTPSLASSTSTVRDLRILSPSSKNSKWHLPKTISPRLLRRRFALILDNSPIFVVDEQDKGKKSKFEVVKSSWAKGGASHVGVMGQEDLWWLTMDDPAGDGKGGT